MYIWKPIQMRTHGFLYLFLWFRLLQTTCLEGNCGEKNPFEEVKVFTAPCVAESPRRSVSSAGSLVTRQRVSRLRRGALGLMQRKGFQARLLQ